LERSASECASVGCQLGNGSVPMLAAVFGRCATLNRSRPCKFACIAWNAIMLIASHEPYATSPCDDDELPSESSRHHPPLPASDVLLALAMLPLLALFGCSTARCVPAYGDVPIRREWVYISIGEPGSAITDSAMSPSLTRSAELDA